MGPGQPRPQGTGSRGPGLTPAGFPTRGGLSALGLSSHPPRSGLPRSAPEGPAGACSSFLSRIAASAFLPPRSSPASWQCGADTPEVGLRKPPPDAEIPTATPSDVTCFKNCFKISSSESQVLTGPVQDVRLLSWTDHGLIKQSVFLKTPSSSFLRAPISLKAVTMRALPGPATTAPLKDPQ